METDVVGQEEVRARVAEAHRVSALAWAAIPSAVYLAHAAFFNWYIVDDAGIAFVYARNLARGYGLVAQPGLPPVEGYSDFAWVGLLSPFFSLNIFDPHLTPKLLSGLLVIAAFVVLMKGLTKYYGFSFPLGAFALTLLSLTSGFVVWTTSGLENPLYALEVAGLIYVLGKALAEGGAGISAAVSAGLLAALAGMTRPDGAVFAAAYPLVALLFLRENRYLFIRRIVASVAAFGLVYGAFILFRVVYFGAFLPNTAYAKFSTAYSDRLSLLGKALEPFYGVAAGMSVPLLLILVAAIAFLMFRRSWTRELAALGVLLALSLAIYIVLPEDIMGNYRLATPFFVCFYPFVVLLATEVIGILNVGQEARKKIVRYAAITAALVFGVTGALNTRDYQAKAFAPFDLIAKQYGLRFNEYARQLGIRGGSLLVPDVGGTLYYSDLRVYDLGMLTDRTIAATVIDNRPAFYDFVFEKARPTFIAVHQRWTLLARLDDDPRFRRDYVPLDEEIDPQLKADLGISVYSGEYVRKDAVQGKEGALRSIMNGIHR